MEQDEPVCEMVTERKCRDVQGELVLVFVFAFVFVFVFAFAFVFVFVFVLSMIRITSPGFSKASMNRIICGFENFFSKLISSTTWKY